MSVTYTAARAPSLHGTLIATDRVSTPGPTPGVLKMTFRALRNISLDSWRIGPIVAAALVLLHIDHARTT